LKPPASSANSATSRSLAATSTARTLFTQGLASLQSLGIRRWIPRLLDGCAALAVAQGDPSRAIRFAAATALLDSLGSSPAARQSWLDHTLAPARSALGPEAADRAWTTGTALPLAAAVAEALTPSPTLAVHARPT
jgi:hypothetical protein